MSFTWIPFYEELATRLMEYENRQGELCAMRRTLDEEGLKPGLTQDQLTENGRLSPLTVIDPFTMFSTFNRGGDQPGTLDRRLRILGRLKTLMGLSAPVPSDLDGIPLVDNQKSAFFPWAYERRADDIPALWKLARQAVAGGRAAVQAQSFDRALQVKNVGMAKLTVGLFWLRPRQFLPLDGATTAMLMRTNLPSEAKDWPGALRIMESCVARLGADFPALSLAAYLGQTPRALTRPPASALSTPAPKRSPRYWAGGHLWGDGSHLKEFVEGSFWQLGWRAEHAPKAAGRSRIQRVVERFSQVKVGDHLAIKGWGGRNDLVVYRVGEVTAVDSAQQRVTLRFFKTTTRKLKGPERPGDGSWADALLEITRPEVIQAIFGPDEGNKKGEATGPDTEQRPAVPLNVILYGPPGTGKTWALRNEVLPQILPGIEQAPYSDLPYSTLTLHPSFAYEDFVVGIRPRLDSADGSTLGYTLHPGLFYRACESALYQAGYDYGIERFCALSPEVRREFLRDAAPYVLLIDEINRGNVARILGELITLIEPDKRLGAEHEVIVDLPGTGDKFGVPSNLYIVGTMNTADRSVVALDTALRRRFVFWHRPPRPELLRDPSQADVLVEGVNLRELLTTINQRLIRLKDEDHQIGHSYFWGLVRDPKQRTLDTLRGVFRDSILPLLREYFYDDLGRIGLVLGPAFVKLVKVKPGDKIFPPKFEHDLAEDLEERPVYALHDIQTLTATDFQSVYA